MGRRLRQSNSSIKQDRQQLFRSNLIINLGVSNKSSFSHQDRDEIPIFRRLRYLVVSTKLSAAKAFSKELQSSTLNTGISCQQWGQNQAKPEGRIWANSNPEQQGQ